MRAKSPFYRFDFRTLQKPADLQMETVVTTLRANEVPPAPPSFSEGDANISNPGYGVDA